MPSDLIHLGVTVLVADLDGAKIDPAFARKYIGQMKRAPMMFAYTKEAFVAEVSLLLHLTGMRDKDPPRGGFEALSASKRIYKFIGAEGCVAMEQSQAIEAVTREWGEQVCDFALESLKEE